MDAVLRECSPMALPSNLPFGADAESAFLGVTKSVRGLRWIDRLAPDKVALATAICQQHGLPELLGRVLAARGAGLDTIETWLNPTLRDLLPIPPRCVTWKPARHGWPRRSGPARV